MKILLINPYFVTTMPRGLSEPLGLISIKTYIDTCFSDDVSTKILDFYALGGGRIRKKGDVLVMGMDDEASIINRIKDFEPDVIGITCNFTSSAQSSFEVADMARTACPEAYIVIGGAHASLDAENIMKSHPNIDFIVRGEGEIIFENLIGSIMKQQLNSFHTIKGLCYRRSNGEIALNSEQPLIPDINSLPLPDRTSVDMSFYKRINHEIYVFAKGSPLVTMMTSRGCPYNCTFCSTSLMWKRKWRPMTAKKAFEEMKYLKEHYGAREIAILDDQFFQDKQRVHDLCDYLIEENTGISFYPASGTSPWLIDEDLMKKMKKAGCYRLIFSIETGNKTTMKFIKKPVDLDLTKTRINQANRLGFWTSSTFIIGFPYETREQILETIRYAVSSNVDFSLFLIAQPYPGTELTEIFKKEGLLDEKILDFDMITPSHNTTTMTLEELGELYKYANRTLILRRILFLFNPLNLFTHFRYKFQKIEDVQYFVKILIRGLSRVFLPGLTNRPLKALSATKLKGIRN